MRHDLENQNVIQHKSQNFQVLHREKPNIFGARNPETFFNFFRFYLIENCDEKFFSVPFTKSIAVPVFGDCDTSEPAASKARIVIGVLARRYPTSSLRRLGVTRARFTVALNLDTGYYASRLVLRRNLDTQRRDDDVTPFSGSDYAGKLPQNHERTTDGETFTCRW